MSQWIIIVGCAVIFFKTLVYGIWEWKNNNKKGACVVILLALLSFSPCFVSFS